MITEKPARVIFSFFAHFEVVKALVLIPTKVQKIKNRINTIVKAIRVMKSESDIVCDSNPKRIPKKAIKRKIPKIDNFFLEM